MNQKRISSPKTFFYLAAKQKSAKNIVDINLWHEQLQWIETVCDFRKYTFCWPNKPQHQNYRKMFAAGKVGWYIIPSKTPLCIKYYPLWERGGVESSQRRSAPCLVARIQWGGRWCYVIDVWRHSFTNTAQRCFYKKASEKWLVESTVYLTK